MSEENVKITITFPSLDKKVETDSDSIKALIKATKKKITGEEIIKELQRIKAQKEKINAKKR